MARPAATSWELVNIIVIWLNKSVLTGLLCCESGRDRRFVVEGSDVWFDGWFDVLKELLFVETREGRAGMEE